MIRAVVRELNCYCYRSSTIELTYFLLLLWRASVEYSAWNMYTYCTVMRVQETVKLGFFMSLRYLMCLCFCQMTSMRHSCITRMLCSFIVQEYFVICYRISWPWAERVCKYDNLLWRRCTYHPIVIYLYCACLNHGTTRLKVHINIYLLIAKTECMDEGRKVSFALLLFT